MRNRLDERFSTIGRGTAVRDRARAVITFNNMIKKGISPLVFDEIFFNLNHPEWVSKKRLVKIGFLQE
ncbi:DUF2490 domain-containing protein [Legionella lansingensis]|uniref:DUF2490 domain-containing protein n=1 Tax=Legionella lansingensis TaxID=45067 RepID=UPI0012FD146D|nr:DUF2490 domain-containing protein [Legionella lansingensis]